MTGLINTGYGSIVLETRHELTAFLAGIEKRAFRLTEIAVGNREDALDILQDAMCRLVERYGNRNAGEWGPLFRTILHHRIQDWRRRETVRKRFRVWLPRPGNDEEGDPDPVRELADERQAGPEMDLRNRRILDALDPAIRKLPRRQQQAFLLRVFEDLDVAATAQVMRCTEGSVKTHFSRALQSLRRELEEHR
ncbi:MAG: RNA polymerase sigma factor [Gammaproteobacteria bacterium]